MWRIGLVDHFGVQLTAARQYAVAVEHSRPSRMRVWHSSLRSVGTAACLALSRHQGVAQQDAEGQSCALVHMLFPKLLRRQVVLCATRVRALLSQAVPSQAVCTRPWHTARWCDWCNPRAQLCTRS